MSIKYSISVAPAFRGPYTTSTKEEEMTRMLPPAWILVLFHPWCGLNLYVITKQAPRELEDLTTVASFQTPWMALSSGIVLTQEAPMTTASLGAVQPDPTYLYLPQGQPARLANWVKHRW